VPEHVQNYVELFSGITGREITKEDIIRMSEGVYNFQRVFNIRMGKGLRENDIPPYRMVGPVTREEYLSREERYDGQIREKLGLDPGEMTLEAKMDVVRKYREEQYQKLLDSVYKRRGWTLKGVPTLETLRTFKVDFPEVVAVVKPFLGGESGPLP